MQQMFFFNLEDIDIDIDIEHQAHETSIMK